LAEPANLLAFFAGRTMVVGRSRARRIDPKSPIDYAAIQGGSAHNACGIGLLRHSYPAPEHPLLFHGRVGAVGQVEQHQHFPQARKVGPVAL